MSDAPEGRTYVTSRERTLEPLDPDAVMALGDLHDETEFDKAYDELFRSRRENVTYKTRLVPNGMWVMERPCYGATWPVGVDYDELDSFQYLDANDNRRTLYVSHKPFGFVAADSQDGEYSYRGGREDFSDWRKRLSCARQIHKGELGHTVPIQQLQYVRQAFAPDQKPSVTKPRERRRSNRGWVKLSDLAAAADLSMTDVVFGFWTYSGHLNSRLHLNGQDGGQLLDMVVAQSSDDIKGRVPYEHFTTQAQAKIYISMYADLLWVRRGFACTVLRLLALGVRPAEVLLPA